MNQPNTYEEVMANMVTEIEEGNESALQAFLSFRNIEKVAKDCMKQIEHLALEELFIKEREAQASRHDEDYHYLKWSLQKQKSNKSNNPKRKK